MTAVYSLSSAWLVLVLSLIFTACALLGAVLTIMWQTQRQREDEDATARAETARLRDQIEADIHRAIRHAIRHARPIRRTDVDPEPQRRAKLKTLQGGQ